jgi:hypothetical protein
MWYKNKFSKCENKHKKSLHNLIQWFNKKTNKIKYGHLITSLITLKVKPKNYFNQIKYLRNKMLN